jgi:hypothetical protein
VDRSQSQPQTFQGTGLASDSVAVATIILYHLAKIKASNFFYKLFLSTKVEIGKTKPYLFLHRSIGHDIVVPLQRCIFLYGNISGEGVENRKAPYKRSLLHPVAPTVLTAR